MSDTSLRDAEQLAEQVVRDCGLTLPVDVLGLAQSNGILVSAKPAAAMGVSGMLLRSGDDFAIGYATHVRNEGFQRFSIAHELGHFYLPGHPEHIFSAGAVHESRAGFASGDPIELQADHFAAGLLMPSALFTKEAAKYSDGFTAIEHLAEICKTSLTASAIRYSEITDAALAIVVSSRSSVEYCFLSPAMRRMKGLNFLKKGSVLPRESLTRTFNQTSENISLGRRVDDSTDLQLWFRCDDEIDASEEVIGLGDYGKTLTVITADADDGDGADEGDKPWGQPQFRYR
ncbi:ImmA/IrrE family metallo-endopeptidase [Caballeronia sordidicola]|uniref:ImmA/IrrE family metallo-endopeptidase n=1 Tax=Caballeronia sordidicola TaxID=196367 RepID=UPI0004D01A10|nr:ImmA/IrrE family metallo-endopeptidase [Caballeronia sordidicola]